MPRKAPVSFYLTSRYKTDYNQHEIINVNGNNVNSTSTISGEYTIYTYTGITSHGVRKLLFTKYFIASDNKYYSAVPSFFINGDNAADFQVISSNDNARVTTTGSVSGNSATVSSINGITIGMLLTTTNGLIADKDGVTVTSIDTASNKITLSESANAPVGSTMLFRNSDSKGRVVTRYFEVFYTGTANADPFTGDEIVFDHVLSSNPTIVSALTVLKEDSRKIPVNYLLKSIRINTIDLPKNQSARQFTVVGDPGARFNLSVKNEDTSPVKTYNFATQTFTAATTSLENTIPQSGVYRGRIVFPTVTDDDQYDFTFKKVGNKTGFDKKFFKTVNLNTVDAINRGAPRIKSIDYPDPWTFSIKQYTQTRVTFTLQSTNNSSSYNTLPSNVTVDGDRNTSPPTGTQTAAFTISWALTCTNAAHAFHIIRQPVTADWDNAGGGVTKTVDGAVTSGTNVDIETTGHTTSLSTASLAAGMVVDGQNITQADPRTNVTIASVTDANTIVLSEAQTSLANHDVLSFDNGGTTVQFTALKVEVPNTYAYVHEDASETQNVKLTSAAAAEEVTDSETDDAATSLHSLKSHSTAAYASTVISGKLPRTTYISATPASPANGQTWEFSAAVDSVKAGDIIGFSNSNQATVTARGYVTSFGDKSVNIKLELDNILGVGE